MASAAPLHPRVAYFCMEFGLAAELTIYSGGLGILAGDHIKSAGDLKLPVTGIGILWSEGYTVQRLRESDAVPVDEYPVTPRTHLVDTGVRVSVTVRQQPIELAAWRVTLPGIAPLYLLEPVKDADRWITRRLYAGGADDRVAQEIILGVGGVRLCRALGLPIDVYHFNEGHAVFAGLELVRERMADGAPFETAWEEVRPQIVFTTHTPVLAGNETHPIERLIAQSADLGLSAAQLEAIGGEPFGMTVAGLRLARKANAVAELHGETSRSMWKEVSRSAPIGHVTNGVHPPSWQDERIRVAYATGQLWDVHRKLKHDLLAEVARRTRIVLDPDVLLIGFARRAATYKRADLILRDPALAERLFGGGQVHVLFAGKAHPQDGAGKRIVQQLALAARRWRGRVVFLENYEMGLARHLVRGCDVWLNNPRRPLEASGTSGMKAAMNGVLNVSVLDGWWPEGCVHGVNGWQVGGGKEDEDSDAQDAHDRQALGDVIEGEVLPAWKAGRERWEPMMRSSIEMSQWRFSSYRMLEDYYREIYRV
jgi:glycogen phosphorylase